MFNSELTTDNTTQVYSQVLYSLNIIVEYGLTQKFGFTSIQINHIGLLVNVASYNFITGRKTFICIKDYNLE